MIDNYQANAYITSVGEHLMKYADFVPTYGLMDGKLGIALFLFICSSITKDDKFGAYANDLLDDIFENTALLDALDFDTGLCGLSYGVKYLVTNGFVAPESMEVLTELDNHIFSLTISPNPNKIASIALYWKHRDRLDYYRDYANRLAKYLCHGLETKEFSVEEQFSIIHELLIGYVSGDYPVEEDAKRLYAIYSKTTSNSPHISLTWKDTYLREIIGRYFGSVGKTSTNYSIKLRDLISLQRLHIRLNIPMPSEAAAKIESIVSDKDLLDEFITLSNPRTMNLSGNMLGFAWMLAEEISNKFAV